ncbi:MAG: DNA-directed RNA polymerase subunit P [Candidatus Diapherotrites archaeon]|nr:DNA-directed RNA polymerase subunit P [Candidatus Diapherotrites archaeon]
MATYRCVACGRVFDTISKSLIRCPSCAYRVVEKVRPPVTKKIKAR